MMDKDTMDAFKKIMYKDGYYFWDDPKCTCCGKQLHEYEDALLLPDDGDPRIALCESCVSMKSFNLTW